MGGRRRGADVRRRSAHPTGRSRDPVSAEGRRRLRRRLQRLHHVRRPTAQRLYRIRRPPLRRHGDGRAHGLRRRGRLRAGAAEGGRGRLHRQLHRRHGPLLRPGARPRHHAARAGGLCRLDRARGGDVPRSLPERAAHRAGRLFRQGGDGQPGCLPPVPGAGGGGRACAAHGHAGRALCRGARSARLLRRARPQRAPGDPRLPYRQRAAHPDRRRRLGGGDLASARTAGRGRVRQGQDRRLIGIRAGEVQGHGRRRGADRHRRYRLVPAHQLARDLRHRRHRRI